MRIKQIIKESLSAGEASSGLLAMVIGDAWEEVYPNTPLYTGDSYGGNPVYASTKKQYVKNHENYNGLADPRGHFYLQLSAGYEGTNMIINIQDAHAGKFQGAVTRILGDIFKELEDSYGKGQPTTRTLTVGDDASGGAWAHIAQKLGANSDLHRGHMHESVQDVLYHGGKHPITKFNIPAYGVFFSPHKEWAENYGPVITRAKVNADKIYKIDYNHDIDEAIVDALFDRDYETVARYVKLLQSKGYQAMQTVTDSEMLVVFPGTDIQILNAVSEDINPDIRNPEFEHEQQIGDYRYTAKTHLSDSGFFTYLLIRCYDGDKLIGRVNFEVRILAGKKWLESQNTQVEGGYTNKGIASTMYAYAKMLGNDIKPSKYQSDDGQAMWKAWKKSGAAKQLTSK